MSTKRMTPLDEVRKLRRSLAALAQAVERHAERGHTLSDDLAAALKGAQDMMATEKQSVALFAYTNALGMAKLLGEVAVYVPEEHRETIEIALFDAADIYPIRVTQVIHRFDVEPVLEPTA